MTDRLTFLDALAALADEWDKREPRYGAHREAQAYEDGIAAGFEAAAEELRKLRSTLTTAKIPSDGGAVMELCEHCGNQIHLEGATWVDNSGGDVCGHGGGNEPHEPERP